MDNRYENWTVGNVRINTNVPTNTPKKTRSISEEGFRDLSRIIKNNEDMSEFINFLNSGKSIYNFPPGTFCK
jgi:hypothetical protein